MKNKIYLASASPRRQTLLTQIGVAFELLRVQVIEEAKPGESPETCARRLALEKAQAGWQSPQRKSVLPVLGADTIVVLNNTILGKPKDKADAVRMLLDLSGKTHEVMTAIALVQGDHIETACSISRVQFREISLQEAETYWQTGEPADKAGAYAIQGKAAIFIKEIDGSYSGVMGLPLFETAALLEKFL